jgi:hypothetical protein
MEDDKIYEVNHFLNFHFKHKPSTIQKQKQVVLYYIYHKYTIIP